MERADREVSILSNRHILLTMGFFSPCSKKSRVERQMESEADGEKGRSTENNATEDFSKT